MNEQELTDEQLDAILQRHRPTPSADFQEQFWNDLETALENEAQDADDPVGGLQAKASKKSVASWFMRPQGMAMVAGLAAILLSFPLLNQMGDQAPSSAQMDAEPMTLGAAPPSSESYSEASAEEVQARDAKREAQAVKRLRKPVAAQNAVHDANRSANQRLKDKSALNSPAQTHRASDQVAAKVDASADNGLENKEFTQLPEVLSTQLNALSAQWRSLGNDFYEVSAPVASEMELKAVLEKSDRVEILKTPVDAEQGRKALRFKLSIP